MRARCISPRSSTRSAAASSAGRSRITSAPNWSSTRSRWRSGGAGHRTARRSRIPITAPKADSTGCRGLGVWATLTRGGAVGIDRQHRRRVRQRHGRELLPHHPTRVVRPATLDDPRGARERHVRIHRGVLQSDAPPFEPWDALAHRLRDHRVCHRGSRMMRATGTTAIAQRRSERLEQTDTHPRHADCVSAHATATSARITTPNPSRKPGEGQTPFTPGSWSFVVVVRRGSVHRDLRGGG